MGLYNEVMEIALAFQSRNDDSSIFRVIENALDAYNVEEMRNVKTAFHLLPYEMQRNIMTTKHSAGTIAAVDRFTRHLRHLM